MQISSTQLDAFAPPARARFEDEMFAHLRGFAPQLAEAAGDEALRRVIHHGIDRAANHGFTNRGPVRFYLELLLSFGNGFDTDPQYAAFHPALRNRQLDQMARAITLHGAVKRYFDTVSGPEDRWTVGALGRLQSLAASEDLARWRDAPAARVVALCRDVFPEKFAFVGQTAVAAVIAPCYQAPRRTGPPPLPPAARPVVALLMYGFGAGVLTDPLYPWVQGTVRDTAAAPDDLAERLKRRATLYLARVLEVYRQPA